MPFSINSRPVLLKCMEEKNQNQKYDAGKKKENHKCDTNLKNFTAFMNKSILALHDYWA